MHHSTATYITTTVVTTSSTPRSTSHVSNIRDPVRTFCKARPDAPLFLRAEWDGWSLERADPTRLNCIYP